MVVKAMEIEVMFRLQVRGREPKWLWSNVSGLHAVRNPRSDNPTFAQEYLDEVGEETLMRMIKDFGEYQNWGGEWKAASCIFKGGQE